MCLSVATVRTVVAGAVLVAALVHLPAYGEAQPPAPHGRQAPGGPVPAPAPFVSDTPPARQAGLTGQDSVARLVARASPTRASYSITSTDGRMALLLLDTTLMLQLTDQGLEETVRGDTEDAERGFLASLLDSMLRGGLKLLLNRGIEYSLVDLAEARYESGRLVLWSVRGKDVFESVHLNGVPVMQGFSETDARAFADRVNEARAYLQTGG